MVELDYLLGRRAANWIVFTLECKDGVQYE